MPRRRWDHEVHKYMKVVFDNRRGGQTEIWRCTLPNCQHYLVGEMVIGKLCLCNRCEEEVFEMKKAETQMKRPHCIECTKQYANNRAKPSVAAIAANLDELLKVD